MTPQTATLWLYGIAISIVLLFAIAVLGAAWMWHAEKFFARLNEHNKATQKTLDAHRRCLVAHKVALEELSDHPAEIALADPLAIGKDT